ncbi:hypothetical protein MHB70_30865 [Bacillus sp. FSL M7-1020]|uniref:hypothetical protein n=1 Tax=Bacillus sp. FSL M7-1020 TaxID=2921540 RepID=UPI0018AA1E2C
MTVAGPENTADLTLSFGGILINTAGVYLITLMAVPDVNTVVGPQNQAVGLSIDGGPILVESIIVSSPLSMLPAPTDLVKQPMSNTTLVRLNVGNVLTMVNFFANSNYQGLLSPTLSPAASITLVKISD